VIIINAFFLYLNAYVTRVRTLNAYRKSWRQLLITETNEKLALVPKNVAHHFCVIDMGYDLKVCDGWRPKFIKALKIKTPNFLTLLNKGRVDYGAIGRKVVEEIKYSCVVKPNESGSSIDISIVKSAKDLKGAATKAFNEDRQVLIKEFIEGREITCGVLGNSNETE
jgi:hypothetical protein